MNMALSSTISLLLLIVPIFCAPESKIVDSKSKSEKSEDENTPPEHKSDKMPDEYMKYIEEIKNKCLTGWKSKSNLTISIFVEFVCPSLDLYDEIDWPP